MSASLEEQLQSALGTSYDIERELAPGGMSRLFVARARDDGRLVAIKILPPELASEVNSARFRREIELMALLHHPRILPVSGAGSADGLLYYLMPYVDGESLRQRLTREKQLPVSEAVRIACEVAEALDHAHAQGVVHRDIKPDNILLAERGGVMVADFGIARAVTRAAGDTVTSTGVVVGTPAYMSPEQAGGEHDLDGRTDLYSLGCVLYEMLGGIPPFPGATSNAVIGRRFTAPAPSVRELRPNVPANVDQAISRVLERVPADRFQSAQEFARALTTPSAERAATAGPQGARRLAIFVGAGAAVAALAIVPTALTAPVREAIWHTRSLSAMSAYRKGRESLAHWRIPEALAELRDAHDADPAFPEAALWFAQAAWWSDPRPAPEWYPALLNGHSRPGNLAPRDSVLSLALLAMAHKNYPEACRAYDGILRGDSADVAALMGRGDCNAHDPLVVRQGAGWHDRGSYQSAVQSYLRAVQLTPALDRAFPIEQLQGILFTEATRVKSGFAVLGKADTSWFESGPALEGDTLLWVPEAQGASADEASSTPSAAAAITYARSLLHDVALEWATSVPADPHAREVLAQALEQTGEITSARNGGASAIETARAGRRLSTDPMQQMRLCHIELRLLLKSNQFHAARHLADSALAVRPDPDPQMAGYLAVFATLVGRISLAAEFTQRAAVGLPTAAAAPGQSVQLNPSLVAEGQALYAYASLGAPAESIRIISARVNRSLASYLVEPERSRARYGLLTRPLSLSVPVLGVSAVAGEPAGADYLIAMQQAAARGDRSAVRSRYAEVLHGRRAIPLSNVSIDAVFLESWLLAEIGDTTAAVDHLDLTLNALPSSDPHLIDQLFSTAALVRAMALRADLAAAAGDRPVAARWGRAVTELWAGSDPALQPVMKRMRSYE